MNNNPYYKRDDIQFRIVSCSDGTGEIVDRADKIVGTVSRSQMRELKHVSLQYLSLGTRNAN